MEDFLLSIENTDRSIYIHGNDQEVLVWASKTTSTKIDIAKKKIFEYLEQALDITEKPKITMTQRKR